jgi:hypothetical protein
MSAALDFSVPDDGTSQSGLLLGAPSDVADAQHAMAAGPCGRSCGGREPEGHCPLVASLRPAVAYTLLIGSSMRAARSPTARRQVRLPDRVR